MSLGEINFPSSLRRLGVGSFSGCNSLKSVFIPGGVSFSSWKTTSQMPDSTTTTTENGVTTIVTTPGRDIVSYTGLGAFQECAALESVTFGEGSRAVGAMAFRRCRKLRSVTLPDGLETIMPGAFSECPSLQEILLPDSLKEIGEQWTRAGGGYSCSTTTERSGGVVIITEQRFKEYSVTRDTLNPEAGSFFRCTGLSRIRIPASVAHIGDYTFAACTGLKEIEFMGDKPASYGGNVLMGAPSDLLVSVRKDACGWYDPVTFSPSFIMEMPNGCIRRRSRRSEGDGSRLRGGTVFQSDLRHSVVGC